MCKKVRQNKEKLIIYLLIAGFLAALLINAVLLPVEYRNYREKLDIISEMAKGADTGMDGLAAAGMLLKGHDISANADMSQLLEEYGFAGDFRNIYQQRLYDNWMKIILLTMICYVLYILALLIMTRNDRHRYVKQLELLDSRIVNLRDGIFEVSPEADVWREETEGRILMNLDSLSEHIRMIRQESVQEKEETKSLVTDISHQLKTPVAALKTSFEILNSDGLSNTEQEEFKSRCQDQLLRLEELVGALVNISRMETGIIEIHSKVSNIYDTVVSAVNRIYPEAEKKQIEISFEAQEEMQRFLIPHDTKWMSEALINVLENAIKYSPEGKNIFIRMQKMSMFLRIEIEDQGIGIPKEERNKVFKRFYRGSSEAVKKNSGSGVGLYLTREILARHHGTIAVRQGNGNACGSLFVLQIPFSWNERS